MTEQQQPGGPPVMMALAKYDENRFNILLPQEELTQIAQWHAARVSVVPINADPRAGDIYKVGKRKAASGGDEDLFALTKGPLMEIAQAAGIMFNWNEHGVDAEHRTPEGRLRMVRFKTLGLLRLPDGTWRPIPGSKEIDLTAIEDELRLAARDSLRDDGTWGKEAARWAAKGEWRDVEAFGRTQKRFFITDRESLAEAIEDRVFPAVIQWRKNAVARAETGAMLRMIRAAMGLKQQYTKEELARPFVVARIEFSPDYSDPNVRTALLQHGMSSMSALFGQSKQLKDMNARDGAGAFEAPPSLPSGVTVESVPERPPIGPHDEDIDVTVPVDEPAKAGAPDEVMPWDVKAPAKTNGPECKACGSEVKDRQVRQGGVTSTMSAASIAAGTKDRFGSVLCWDCAMSQSEETKGGAE